MQLKENILLSDTQKIGALRFVAGAKLSDLADELCERSQQLLQGGCAVHLANAYTLALAEDDLAYRETLVNGSFVVCDGRPIQSISRLLKHRPVVHQVRGPALFREVLDRGRERDVRHFLLGGSPEVLEALEASIRALYNDVNICGSYSPPFRPMTPDELAQQDALIMSADPDIVWVGLGTPKQDYETARIARTTGLMAIAVGAAFDFIGGSKKEAPVFVQLLGLEWMYRLMSEPKRLWRRYLLGGGKFLVTVLRNLDSRRG